MGFYFRNQTVALHWLNSESGHTPEWKQVVVSEVKRVTNALMHSNALGIKVAMNNT